MLVCLGFVIASTASKYIINLLIHDPNYLYCPSLWIHRLAHLQSAYDYYMCIISHSLNKNAVIQSSLLFVQVKDQSSLSDAAKSTGQSSAAKYGEYNYYKCMKPTSVLLMLVIFILSGQANDEPHITEEMFFSCMEDCNSPFDFPMKLLIEELKKHGVIDGSSGHIMASLRHPMWAIDKLYYVMYKTGKKENGLQIFYQCLKETQDRVKSHKDAVKIMEVQGQEYTDCTISCCCMSTKTVKSIYQDTSTDSDEHAGPFISNLLKFMTLTTYLCYSIVCGCDEIEGSCMLHLCAL